MALPANHHSIPAVDLGPAFAHWRVYYERDVDDGPASAIGRPCVVGLAAGGATFATPQRTADGSVELRAIGGQVLEPAAVAWVARIVSMKPGRAGGSRRRPVSP